MLRTHYARRWLGEPKPSERRLGERGHDLAEVPAVELAVPERAVLEETDAQDLDRAAILQVHDHLRVAHEALLVGRNPTGVGEEIVHCTLCDGEDLTWF